MVNQPHELKQKTQKVMFAVAKLNKHWAKQQTIKDEISTAQYSCKLNQKHIHIKKIICHRRVVDKTKHKINGRHHILII